jgi:hypothetical protein
MGESVALQSSLPSASEPLTYRGPEHAPSFQEIVEAGALGSLSGPHRLRLGEKMFSAPGSPLFRAASLPDLIVSEHTNRVLLEGAELYALTGYELGGYGLLHNDGRVLTHDGIQPAGYNHMITPDRMPPNWSSGLFSVDTEIIEFDALVGVGLNGHLVWGHFLLEMMTRVHLLAQMSKLGKPVKIAVPADGPKWIREFIGLYFSEEDMLFYEAGRHRVRARCFILPGMMMHHYYMHPAVNFVVEELLQRLVPSYTGKQGSKRLYLSRSGCKGSHAIDNEPEVESTLSNLGFDVIHPQELSLRQQLALYSNAECMVSMYSSASHNAIFAPRGARIFCFGWMNRCQSGIAALRGQPIAYMSPSNCDIIYPPAEREPGPFRMRIDCGKLPQELDAFLRFADMLNM